MKIFLLAVFCLMLLGQSVPAATEAHPVHVAFIFDDGPFPEHAPKLLEICAREKIHVTFGTVAQKLEASPAVAKQVIAAGHELANHSYSHQHPKSLDDATLEREVVGAQHIFEENVGYSPKWYWPPFLEADPRLPATATRAKLTIYRPVHLVVSKDYDNSVTAEQIYQNSVTGVVDGTVILCHEWREETAQQLPAIIAELRRQGCVFLTFSELAEYTQHQH